VAPAQLKAAWNAVQSLVKQGLVSAGHDISDGGIATTLLEMAFAGGHKFLHEQLIATQQCLEISGASCLYMQMGGHTRVTRMSIPVT
jgi:phosphoribosylformylglycinamidine (FGAM) synthase-like enzyme